MPGPGSIPVTDDLVGPIVSAMSSAISTQLASPPSVIYTLPPDGQPENNSCLIAFGRFDLEQKLEDGWASGKYAVKLTFNVQHYFRRSRWADDLQNCYNYLHAYLNLFSAWGNQSLGGLTRTVTPMAGGVMRDAYAGTPFVVLSMRVEVCTDVNILLT